MEPQNIKAIFFDIDGTLVSFQTHGVPSSAARAIETLRSRGTKVFIATGRPFYQIINLGELRFDGYVTLNGAWCIDAQGEVIFSNPIPHEDLEAVNRRLDARAAFPVRLYDPGTGIHQPGQPQGGQDVAAHGRARPASRCGTCTRSPAKRCSR